MRINIVFTLLAASLSFVSKVFAEADPNFHIYLAFGQSNMEGQGPIEEQDLIPEERFKMISTTEGCKGRHLGEWYDAVPPLASCIGRLGPVDYFGRTLVKKLPEEIKVGVVVVAVAGCDIQLFEQDNYQSYTIPDWMQPIVDNYDGNPYGRLIDMAKKAQEVGVIKGILLHQGETNTAQQTWPGRVKNVYEDILNDLGLKAEDVPLLAGEVVHESNNGQCAIHNKVLDTLPDVIPTCHVISSKDLPAQDDNVHFTTESYREFGERYANEMLKILGYDEKKDECWATALGYDCCKKPQKVIVTDENGQWGAENGEWCGIIPNDDDCWAEAEGYECCNTDKCQTVLVTDEAGKWGAQNGEWCGITDKNTIC